MNNPYLDPARVRSALRALQLRPSRGMGQNFLVDPQALAAIVAAAELGPVDTALEVGPGLGVLTWELVRRAGTVVAVELDKRLADRLRQEFASARNLTIVQADVLKLPPEELLAAAHDQRPTTNDQRPTTGDERAVVTISDAEADAGERSSLAVRRSSFKVVANLPYAITSPVLRHFLEARLRPELLVVLVQWEVAERIAAGPGDLSVLAHAVQLYATPEIVARVPAASFVPAPAV
ncbi:MAG TPA: rRNA adenine dimethyltransferase family protein, partial [Roseiflexaceae bacterium]|nr:rRNA adenine dimethyltransferase family protein [Roseiflexaceae bacterium]